MAFQDKDPFERHSPPGNGPGRVVEYTPEEIQKMVKNLLKGVVGLLIFLALLWGSFSSFYTIQPEEQGVIRRFGKYAGLADPGLHFKIPFNVDQVTMVPKTRVLKEEFGFRTLQAGARSQFSNEDFTHESLMLTGDLNVIEVAWIVQYRIDKPDLFLFEIHEPVGTLRDVSESVMRRIVGNRMGSSVLTTGRNDISGEAQDEIQRIMDSYKSGINIVTVELRDVVPPKRVQPAFNDVNVARQAREQMINEAEKRRNQQLPRTEGQALQLIAEAEGYAIERINRAQGDTARFNAILSEYRMAPEVTRQRLYLETIDKVLPKAGQVVVVQENQMGPLPLLDLLSAKGGVK